MTSKEYNKIWRKRNKKHCQEYRKNYYQKNKEKQRKYQKENRDKILKYLNEYYQKHKKEAKNYYRKNRKRIAQYKKERRKRDINYRIKCCLRNRIRIALKNNYKKSSTIELLGCTILELRKHLEKQFKKGMTWKNHGRIGWHIDHIIPCCEFKLSKLNEQLQCFNYRNLQPLWAKENYEKTKKRRY